MLERHRKTVSAMTRGKYDGIKAKAKEKASGEDVLSQFVELMWMNPQMADPFIKNRKGWQQQVGKELKVDLVHLEEVLKGMDRKELVKIVTINPAGEAPMVRSAQNMSGRAYLTGNCGTTICQTTVCQTTACQTTACQTAYCQSGRCKFKVPEGPI